MNSHFIATGAPLCMLTFMYSSTTRASPRAGNHSYYGRRWITSDRSLLTTHNGWEEPPTCAILHLPFPLENKQ